MIALFALNVSAEPTQSPRQRWLDAFFQAANESARVWPGLEIWDRPFLLTDGTTWNVLYGHPNPPANFSPFTLRGRDFHTSSQPPDFEGLNYSYKYELGGIAIYARRVEIANDLRDGYRTMNRVFHNQFHEYQTVVLAGRDPLSSQLGQPTAFDIADADAENRLLKAALGESDLEALRDFIAIRSRTPSRADHGEWVEGIATYYDLRVFESVRGEGSGIAEILGEITKKTDPVHRKASRYYRTGAAIGYLLDRLGADWKDQIKAGVPPFQILSEAISMPDTEIDRRAARVRSTPEYETALGVINAELVEERRAARSAQERYDSAEGPRVRLILIRNSVAELRFNAGPKYDSPNREYTLHTGGVLGHGKSWDVEIFDRILLMRWKHMARDLTFALGGGARWTIDGREWEPSAGVIQVREVAIENDSVEIRVSDAFIEVEDSGMITIYSAAIGKH
ncbi:MAG: hypothetical protein COB53_00520 [Elusimicrobia bacterium]|nr:MAG: hypothetical protein COB53_00520 [Elusimicrobiota bacterium]